MKTLGALLIYRHVLTALTNQEARIAISLGRAALLFVVLVFCLSAVFCAVDWNVILMIAGTMGTVFCSPLRRRRCLPTGSS